VYLNEIRGMLYIIVVNVINSDTVVKRAFNTDGTFIHEVTDKLNSDGSMNRSYKKTKITIGSNKEIEFKSKLISLTPIKSVDLKYNKQASGLPNTNIGVLDLETYEDVDTISKVYSIGFYSHLDNEPVLFYIDKNDLDSDKLVCLCIDEMLRDKYKGTTFYVHNLENFDAFFIIKALINFNESEQGKLSPYYITPFNRNKYPIKLTIKRKINGVLHTLKICDSYAILPDSLHKLGQAYNVEVVKDYFPHNFVNKKTLFYLGKTPDYGYYKNLSESEYQSRVYNT